MDRSRAESADCSDQPPTAATAWARRMPENPLYLRNWNPVESEIPSACSSTSRSASAMPAEGATTGGRHHWSSRAGGGRKALAAGPASRETSPLFLSSKRVLPNAPTMLSVGLAGAINA